MKVEDGDEDSERRTLIVRAQDGETIMGEDLVLAVTGDETVVQIQEVRCASTGGWGTSGYRIHTSCMCMFHEMYFAGGRMRVDREEMAYTAPQFRVGGERIRSHDDERLEQKNYFCSHRH